MLVPETEAARSGEISPARRGTSWPPMALYPDVGEKYHYLDV